VSITLGAAPIDFTALVNEVRSPQAGAVVLFLGTVREFTAGRQTEALHYEAYPTMARQQLEQLVAQCRERWPVNKLAVAHRTGRLELGEISVAVAVSSSHRDDAFQAGRFLIDELKRIVPIWKQEIWADGTTEWVHPAGIDAAGSPDTAPRP
jgi:molybdopterin synthase catalytic subunit